MISDSRFPLKRSQSGKPIVKINADEISKFQGLGLSELVRQYAGIEVSEVNLTPVKIKRFLLEAEETDRC